jgi:hypothetical protein
MRRSPLRFTIRTLQIAVVGAALFFTLCLYVDPRLYWREIAAFLFCPLMCALVLAIALGSGCARRFGMGFLVGFVLEHAAMAYCVNHSLVRYSTTTLAPEGWYPLEIPLERMFLLRGWADLNSASVPATFSGLLVSGILCGGLAFAIGETLNASLRRHAESRSWRIGGGVDRLRR